MGLLVADLRLQRKPFPLSVTLTPQNTKILYRICLTYIIHGNMVKQRIKTDFTDSYRFIISQESLPTG